MLLYMLYIQYCKNVVQGKITEVFVLYKRVESKKTSINRFAIV